MSDINSFQDLVVQSTAKKTIQSFDEAKHFLSNEILIQYQYDLPKEFDVYDILSLPNHHRFMRNFSKTMSYTKSLDYLKKELTNYFTYSKIPVERPTKVRKTTNKHEATSFKQVFFNLESTEKSKLVVDDITNFNLQQASVDSLQNVIDAFKTSFGDLDKEFTTDDTLTQSISSDSSFEKTSSPVTTQSSSLDEEPELANLLKDFNIELVKHEAKVETQDIEYSKEELLNEALDILGIGSIKKNLGKSIITKKKKVGLSFDEWFKENLDWAQYLIKKIAHIDYLSLQDEADYLAIIRAFSFSNDFNFELAKLYKTLGISQTN